MKIITVVSPDRISLNMFQNYMTREYYKGDNISTLGLNSLISEQKRNEIINTVSEGSKGTLLVLLKTKAKSDIRKNVGDKLFGISSLVVKLDLYSVTPEYIKDDENEKEKIESGWKDFVKKLEKA